MKQNKLPLPAFCLDRDKFGILIPMVSYLFVKTSHQKFFGEEHPLVTGFQSSLADVKDTEVTSARKVLGPHCQHSHSDPVSHPASLEMQDQMQSVPLILLGDIRLPAAELPMQPMDVEPYKYIFICLFVCLFRETPTGRSFSE